MVNRIALGNLVVDPDRHEVWVAERRIDLTFSEFVLLARLADKAGTAVGREELLAMLPGRPDGNTRKLTLHISRLRKKMGDSRPWQVETIRKRGYSLVSSGDAWLPPFVLAHAPADTGRSDHAA